MSNVSNGSAKRPRLRLLFVDIALVLRNDRVWLHFKLAKGKWKDEPQLFLQQLRFREMLLWIGQVVGRLLAADKNQGLDRKTDQRLTKICLKTTERGTTEYDI